MDNNMQPVVLLVEPQLGQNIGKVARAMLNFNLTELRLINPRQGWLGNEARMLAAGADQILDQAQCFDSFDAAIADLQRVYATSVRPRDIIKQIVTPHELARRATDDTNSGCKIGFLFGPERTGLRNEHIVRADAVVTIPVNPSFGSLNLAQAVIVIAYEWYQASQQHETSSTATILNDLATKDELAGFLNQLENELASAGYFRTEHKRPQMTHNLFNIFSRMALTALEVRTLRGVISTLVKPNGINFKKPNDKIKNGLTIDNI